MSLRLRPHHVLCAIGFEGRGYDDAFTSNMARIVMGGLRAPDGPRTEILITGQADALCAPCPNRDGLGCTKQATVSALDRQHAAALRIAPGDRLTWGACLERVLDHVAPGDLSRICDGCQWLELGICERALARLHAEAAGGGGGTARARPAGRAG
ncbi:DUF1284 domain-containing protein [Jannaschia ovalis]|uniref:DUF1284 domain-containing protein n=1 Tax=Jannaschia ovalis TaxID=3038773 RepID=A0ABY8LAN1_9RHOB|nr:DUF1284 domain-containing protein [Jannaschia sp. GRR-S6-38]WGH78385.1 DUF1284 domain-containing protein [Jannaschia sp. GRR-S6-38]